MLHRLSRKSIDQGLVGFEFGTGLRARQSTGLWGAGGQADLQSAGIRGRKEGHLGNKFQEKNMKSNVMKNYQADQIRQRNELVEENILKQVDKSFVLCIDPETKLPFMINMGLKMADVCDLDNRPLIMKHTETAHQVAEWNSSNSKSSDHISFSSASDVGAAVNKTLKSTKNSVIGSQYTVQRLKARNPLLNPKNYPFYQKIKRNLYMMEQLLTD